MDSRPSPAGRPGMTTIDGFQTETLPSERPRCGGAGGVLRWPCDATGKSGARPALPPQLSAASPRHRPLSRPRSGREGAVGDDPEPGDLRIAPLAERLYGTVPR